jgi:uncharacterized protein YjbI with pentapeptide repeats
MANPEHLKILKQGVEQWNRWRNENRGADPDLKLANLFGEGLIGVDLSGANLSGVNLSAARLVSANLSGAMLTGADLSGADLSGANLARAGLRGANLSASRLFSADLSGAILYGVSLGQANLSKADFTQAVARGIRFDDVDLSTAKGLETIEHLGPSTIGIDTVYKSHGEIPEVFLRGCGVPDNFIRYRDFLTGKGLEFYSCFISYSTRDQEFADRLYADLQKKGVRCWFAPHDIKGGRKIHEQLDEAIRLHDKLLLILSEHSMSSTWVGTEIGNAREREARERKQMLFPITLVPYEDVKKWRLFDADRGKDSAKEVREYFIPDFSNWKDHDSYQTAFQRLVKNLKAGASG